MKKILAISHAYIEPFTRTGLIPPHFCDEICLNIVVPKYMVKKYPQGYKKLVEENYEVKPIGSIFNFHHSVRMYLPSLYFLILKLRPNIIFINNEPWSSTAFQIVLFCRIFYTKVKIIVYTCENLIRKYPFPFRLYEKFVLKNVDLVLILSKKDGENVLRKKDYTGQIIYLPLFVDTEIFKKQDRTDLRKILIGKDKIVIGYVGRLVKEKGVDLLIEAVRMLNYDNLHLLIIGDGPQRQHLINLVKEKGLVNKVSFLGSIFYTDLPKYLNCLDILVLPSYTTSNWKEQFGRVLIEAMACEVAVIGSSSGEIPEVIGDAGLVFKEGDCYDLSKKIELLMNDEQLRKELARKGRERVVKNYSWQKITVKLLQIYKNILE
ncbi:MAG: glycosyltransferase [Candidatus Micrarchaeia archaeon]